jgi:hypothetical protein
MQFGPFARRKPNHIRVERRKRGKIHTRESPNEMKIRKSDRFSTYQLAREECSAQNQILETKAVYQLNWFLVW